MSAESALVCTKLHLGFDSVSSREGIKLETIEQCLNLTNTLVGPLFQATFELAFCECSDTLESTCDEYERCRDTSISHLAALHTVMQVHERVRIAEYLALKRMRCLLQIVNNSTEESENAHNFQTWQNRTFDMYFLKIVYPSPRSLFMRNSHD